MMIQHPRNHRIGHDGCCIRSGQAGYSAMPVGFRYGTEKVLPSAPISPPDEIGS